jgi:hypothetical protein
MGRISAPLPAMDQWSASDCYTGDLHQKALAAILDGRIPPAPPHSTIRGHPGSGALCDLCARAIDNTQSEIEVILRASTAEPNPRVLHLHGRCAAAWHDASAQHPLDPFGLQT